jgi:hypothetical protein
MASLADAVLSCKLLLAAGLCVAIVLNQPSSQKSLYSWVPMPSFWLLPELSRGGVQVLVEVGEGWGSGWFVSARPISFSSHKAHMCQWPVDGVHSIMMVKSAQPGEAGGCARPPPSNLSTFTSKVVVYAPAERADTLPLVLLYPYIHSWVRHPEDEM